LLFALNPNTICITSYRNFACPLFILKHNEDQCILVLEEANKLREDLLEEELRETENHRDFLVSSKNQLELVEKRIKKEDYPVVIVKD
jgi:hypothetical protein